MSKDHFDARAATYDDPAKEGVADEVARGIVAAGAAVPGQDGGLRLLEYGAGTGLVTQALSRRVQGVSATLVDSSAGMREVMQAKIAAGTLPADSRVVDLDLEHEEPPADRYDLVVASLVLHHVHDLDRVLTGLLSLLDEGGHLCVADLDSEDGSFHASVHDFDGHHGFDRHTLAERMRAVGLTEVSVADCTSIEKEGAAYPVFLATGRRVAMTSDEAAGPARPELDDLKGWLLRYLQSARDALLWKLEGLSEYDLRRPLTPTGTNLLGLVKHLASVELGYLGDSFGRPSGIPLPWYDDDAEANADLWATADETSEEIIDFYRRAWAHGDATVAALDLDARGQVPWWGEHSEVSLGQILVHLTTETHRHAGHADIVRELIDGQAGLRPGVSNLPEQSVEAWAAHRERVEGAARAAGHAETLPPEQV
ncbi:DUF664 domain-containing protein [Ornithinimicrobium tianjinense]|uniref:Methyltransferase domain-containing protein n=1 Tax=Ornithinimicrobium tianjinense TaxID=1195761 RepID=A0A917F6G5_9MICO|nr:DUF664 domain-containing protein [Ornithinimicrobium tianjinense]GGF52427.1 hypothetical protein GCM10011366_20320 [Ornithinimicrobium tianjinense]